MSIRTDVVNLNINVNGNKAQNELNNLRKKAADVKFEMDGLKKGTADYIAKSKELAQVNSQMSALKKEIGLTALTQKELVNELSKLKSIRGSVIPFSNEYKELSKSIKGVEERLYNVRNGVQGFTSSFSKVSNSIKQVGIAAVGYLGFQFITSQFQNIIRSAGKLSDQLADLRRVAGLTAEEALHLNTQFKELDTRTSTEGLRNIAIIAGKLGVAKENIYDFTKAVDQLVVSLGDELGDADQITTQLGKILNVFDGKVTGDNISKLGNAFVVLANTGAATGGFIADFDQRLSGIAKSAGISLGALSGLGAGLEEMGARVESSSTAIQKLIISIASDIPAAAKTAGLSVAEFDKLFKLDPTEAILKYSEGLVKNKKSFAEVTASLKDAGEEGARTIETITKLGTGADKLRERIKLGTESIKENSAITEAFALKNETFGATLEKLGKEFNKLVTSPGITNFLKSAIEGALSFVKAIAIIPAGILKFTLSLGALIVGVALFNSGMIQSARLSLIQAARTVFLTTVSYAYAISLTVTRLATTAVNASQTAYSVIVTLLTGRIGLATAAQRLWTIALTTGLGPVGLLVIAIGVVVTAFGTLGNSFKSSAKEIGFHNETVRTSTKELAKEKSEIDTLTEVLKDHDISLKTRENTLKDLIALSPEYLSRLTLENITTQEGKGILDEYNKSLEANANLKAAAAIKNREFDKNVQLRSVKQELEIGQKSGSGFGDLSNDAQAAFSKIKTSVGRTALTSSLLNIVPSKEDFAQAFKDIDSEISKSTENQNAATDNYLAKQKEKETARRQFLLKEITDTRLAQNALTKGTDAYIKAGEKYEEARKKYFDEFGGASGKIPKADNKQDGKDAAAKSDKKDDGEFDRLKKEAEKFYKDVQDLKKRIDKNDTPEDQEVQRATQKYEELLLKAKNYFLKHASTQKAFGEEEKIIEEQKQRELQEIFEKYLKKRLEEGDANEYEASLTARREFSNQLKIQAGKDYADGKLSKAAYANEIKQIDKDETHDRIIIAEDYSKTVKKAAADVTAFRKKEEQDTTDDIIKQTDARTALNAAEEAAKLHRAVLNTRPGSAANLKALHDELKNKEEVEVQAEKDKQASLGAVIDESSQVIQEIRDKYRKQDEDIDKQHTQQLIDNIVQYVGYFQQALSSLNQIINNKENAQFNKEKALNNKKKKEYKSQLDNKLISQAQYDKKVNDLQEEQDKKEAELKRKQAKREKALNLFRAIVNTAAAVASALTAGPGIGIALAVITGVLGALEIAAIASQPLPEAGDGKYFGEGDKHSDASGGIPIKVERGEAVITAGAMDDDKQYQVTGTPKQITSALNSQAGGVSWAGGAIVKRIPLISNRPSRINPNIPEQLKNGGIIKDINSNSNNSDAVITWLKTIATGLNELKEAHKDSNKELHAVVSIKEYREKEKQYDSAQKLSGLG